MIILLNDDRVLDHDMDPALPWEDSTLCSVTIMLNGRHLVRDHDVDQSSTGRLSFVLSSHSLGEWRLLVCYQVFDLVSNYAA